MKIRRLQQHEIPLVLELWKLADAEPSVTDSVEDISRILEREYATFLVAEIDGQIAGTIIATFDGWRAIVYRLAVHPDFRRHKIGMALSQKAEEMFRYWGARRVIAIVNSSRPVAMSFWAAAGYKNDGMVRFYKNI